jgi:hypothetical protein
VSNGETIIMGVVANETEKKAVEKLIRGMKGIHIAESQLRVMNMPVS